MDNGWLLPDYYKNWWIGLNKDTDGSWVWTDGLATCGQLAAVAAAAVAAAAVAAEAVAAVAAVVLCLWFYG